MGVKVAFVIVVALVIAERIIELAIARRNTFALTKKGAIEFGREHYRSIVTMHALFFVSMLFEAWVGYPIWTKASYFYAGLFLLAQAARIWVLATLGQRWTTRVLVIQGEVLVRKGPYRFISHPNYLVVAAEILSLPSMFGLYWTAFVFTIANAYLLLRRRLPAERRALQWATSESSLQPPELKTVA